MKTMVLHIGGRTLQIVTGYIPRYIYESQSTLLNVYESSPDI